MWGVGESGWRILGAWCAGRGQVKCNVKRKRRCFPFPFSLKTVFILCVYSGGANSEICYSYCPLHQNLWQRKPSLASGLRPRPWRFTAINSDVVDNKCYIPTGMKNACYLSYLTLDTTSYQSQGPNDNLVRMTQPVLSL